MDLAAVRTFFMWCTILNAGLLVLSFLIMVSCLDWVHRIHGRWFPMPRETFTVVIYGMLGVFKMMFIVGSFVPYIALVIMG